MYIYIYIFIYLYISIHIYIYMGVPNLWGYPQSSSIFVWDFPGHKKPSSEPRRRGASAKGIKTNPHSAMKNEFPGPIFLFVFSWDNNDDQQWDIYIYILYIPYIYILYTIYIYIIPYIYSIYHIYIYIILYIYTTYVYKYIYIYYLPYIYILYTICMYIYI